MQAATFFLAMIGAASALVVPMAEAPNTLIQYQPWCPVCDTVELNTKCLNQGSSCRSSTFMPAGDADCTSRCASTCQRVPTVQNSDFGYTCNVTTATS